MSIEEPNLPKGFIKTFSILLGRLPFKVIGILDLGLEHLLQLSHLFSIEVLMLFKLLLYRGNPIFEIFLLGLPLFLLSRVSVLDLSYFLLQQTDLPRVRFPESHKLLFKLGYGPHLNSLFKLHITSYYTGSEACHLDPLEHPCNSSCIEHINVKRGL